ncbi:hypothetical protein GJAV_G00088710 [Gymnothorax javanicus]|nr:hypothetical protein GJAV_G00088710 [Gymnothorax javanicus]
MMQAGVRVRQDTETTLPELPEQHRIRKKEEELYGLESVHMAESETKCTAPGPNTLEPECVTANSRVSDLHHAEASLIKKETYLGPINTGDLKTESLNFADLAYVTHLHPDQIKTEANDGDYIKTENVSVLQDIKCVIVQSEEVKLESSEVLVSDLMNAEVHGTGVDEKGQRESWECAGEPSPNNKKSWGKPSEFIRDVGIQDVLPEPYEYLLTSYTSHEQNSGWFSATLRLPVKTAEDAKKWQTDFEKVSKTTMRVSKTYPGVGHKIIYKIDMHCQHNTRTSKSAKDTGCKASMSIVVKRTDQKRTRSTDIHLRSFPTTVTLRYTHNHPIECADVLRHRDVSDEVKEKFLGMFQMGYSPSAALECHKYDLQIESQDDSIFQSADRALVPDIQWCYSRLYYAAGKAAYGSDATMLKDLQQLVDQLNSKKGEDTIKMAETDNKQVVMAICTPLMKRVLEKVPQSGEMCFVDSSGNTNRHNVRVFLLMTHSCAGGLPVGCLITTSKSEHTITAALDLYKSLLSPDSFSDRGLAGPKIFMTNDCDAERSALCKSFPDSVQILCVVHVLQATWRWLWDGKNKIPMADRQSLFYAVKSMVYSETSDALDEAYEKVLSSEQMTAHPSFMKCIEKVYNRRELWAVCFRKAMPVRGDHTNNFCEAAVCVLQEKILMRTKAFNALQLVHFIVGRMECFYERKLLDMANNRPDKVRNSKYMALCTGVDRNAVKKISDHVFEVPSETTVGKCYHVDMEVDMCTCRMGMNGGPCKHQAVVVKKFKMGSLNFMPMCSPQIRQSLYNIATGKTDAPLEWFSSLNQSDEVGNVVSVSHDSQVGEDLPSSSGLDHVDSVADSGALRKDSLDPQNTVHKAYDNRVTGRSTVSRDTASDSDMPECEHMSGGNKIKAEFMSFASTLATKVESDPDIFLPAFRAFLNRGHKLCTDSAIVSALNTFGKYSGSQTLSKKTRQVGGLKRIGVQPTAIARRRKMALGGRKRIASGRRAKVSSVAEHGHRKEVAKRKGDFRSGVRPKKKMAAPCNLAECVSRNQSQGKTHSKQ